MAVIDKESKILALAESHGVDPGAYQLVFQSIDFALKRRGNDSGYVSIRRLVRSLLQYAVQEFGLAAYRVLFLSDLATPLEMGRRVFELVAADMLSAGREESLKEFDLEIDFRKAADEIFWAELRAKTF